MVYTTPRPMEFGGNPLVNDDQTLTPTGPIEFGGSPAGLDLQGAPAAPLGLQGMSGAPQFDEQSMLQAMQALENAPLLPPAQRSTQAQMFYSPSTGDMVVNGFQFNQRNASQALASEEWARQPRREFTLPDTASDWRPMSTNEYANYLDTIRNPSFGRRMGEAWEHAWRGVGDIALGASLAANPDWEWAQTARQNILREYEENAPFMMQLREIESPGDAATWFAQSLVQGIPWIFETIASMVAGAAIGGAATGGPGAVPGAIEGVFIKEGIRRATMQALRNNLTRGAAAYTEAQAARTAGSALTRDAVIESAARTGTASADEVNRFFDFVERAHDVARSGRTGAYIGAGASNYATGVGDIRNSIADAGGDPESAEAVANIWGLAIPYAAIESLGDLVVTAPITQLFPNISQGRNFVSGALRHGALTAASEGIEEGAQLGVTELATSNATNQPFNIEPIDLLETVLTGSVAGFGIGAPIGALGPRSQRPGSATTLPSDINPPETPSGAWDEIYDPNVIPGLVPEEGDPLYQSSVLQNTMPESTLTPTSMGQLDLGRGLPTVDEREYLRNVLGDPNATPEQRESARLGLEMLEGGGDPNAEAAQRYRDQAPNRGVDPTPPYTRSPMSMIDEGVMMPENERIDHVNWLARQQYDRDMNVDIPPGVMHDNAATFHALATGKEVSREAIQQLRDEIARLYASTIPPVEGGIQGPAGPNAEGYANVLAQLDSMLRVPLVEPSTEKPEPYISPMEAARTVVATPQRRGGPSARVAIPPADGLRGRTRAQDLAEEAAAQTKPAEPTVALEQKFDPAQEIKDSSEKLKKGSGKKNKRQRAKGRAERKAQVPNELRPFNRHSQDRENSGLRESQAEERRMGRFLRDSEKTAREVLKQREEQDAVQERSTKGISFQEQARRGKKASEENAARNEAPKESTEEVQVPEVDNDRVQRAYKALIANSEARGDVPAKDPAQRVRGVMRSMPKKASSKTRNINRIKNPWTIIDGKPLTREEMLALERMFPTRKEAKEEATPQRTKAEPVEKPNKAEKKAKRFGEDLADALQRNKDDRKAFASFMEDNRDEVIDWLTSDDAKIRAGLARTAEMWLRDNPAPRPQQAAVVPFPERFNLPSYTEYLKADPEDNERVKAFKVQAKIDLAYIKGVLDELNDTVRNDDAIDTYRPNVAANLLEEYANAWPTKDVGGQHLPAMFAALASKVKRVVRAELARLNDQPQQAASEDGKSEVLHDAIRRGRNVQKGFNQLRHARLWELIQEVAIDGRLLKGWRETIMELAPDEFRNVTQVNKNLEALLAGDSEASVAARAFLRQKPQRSVPNQPVSGKGITKADAIKVVNKIQRLINPDHRFASVNVFDSIKDVFDRANDIKLTTSTGREMTLGQYIMREVALIKQEQPELRDKLDAHVAYAFIEQRLMSRAVVVRPFNDLFVFSNNISSERQLIETLEHEYIVHKGLDILFPTTEERNAFLTRVAQIPGVEAKRKALVERFPRQYGPLTHFQQIEEVLAWHAEEGPLAFETLLSAKEGVDPVSKLTLWETFKKIVSDWVQRIFGTRAEGDRALDTVINSLRQHAIVGASPDLMYTLLKLSEGTTEIDPIVQQMIDREKPQMAAATGTPEATGELLFGTNTNPGRPHTPTPYHEQLAETIRSNLPLMEKVKEITTKHTGTSVKEGLRKIGRNIETMNNMALRSKLIEQLMQIMHNTIGVARRIMSKTLETRQYAVKAAETALMRKLWGDKSPGSNQAQRNAYNKMAVIATSSKLPLASDEVVRAAPRLVVRHANGLYTINRAVFEELLKKGTFSKEDFINGIEQYTVSGDGTTTSRGKANLTKEEVELGYDIYVAETRHMAQSKLETLEHALIMLNQMNDSTVARMVKNNEFEEKDQAFVTEMLERMYRLYSDVAFHNSAEKGRKARHKQKNNARQLLAELMRTMHSEEKVEDWLNSEKKRPEASEKYNNQRKKDAFYWRNLTSEEVKPFAEQIRWFLQKDEATGLHRLERLNSLGVKDRAQYNMLGAFQGLLNTSTQVLEHENSVIQSVLGNYVEFSREGDWRVAVEVRDEKGNKIDVNPELYAVLPVTYANSKREADALQAEWNKEFEGTFTILDSKNDEDVAEIQVTFDVTVARAPGTRTLSEAPSIKEFLEVADTVGLKLDATQMKLIANLIENAAERKRFGLQRAGTPGMDANILQNNSEYMTRNAWWAAKMSQAWMLDDVMADKKNVEGDWGHLAQLQREFDIANRGAPEGEPAPTGFFRNEQAVYLAETKLLRYAHQLRHMTKHSLKRPTVNIRTTKGEQKLKIEGEGEVYRKHGIELHEALQRNDLELNLNDLISKTGPARMLAVTMQLGSVASGIMNAFSLLTHLPHVLMTRHPNTGYGEGFGFSDTVSEIIGAGEMLKTWKGMANSANVKQMLDDAKAGNNPTGLTIEELEFIYQETLDGLLMPQQTYSLTGGTESNISNLFLRNLSEALLGPFSAFEAANRRVSALATYRLAKKRYIAAGVDPAKLNDPKSEEYKQLVRDVQTVVWQSQGDYANINRPKAFRGDLAQYVFMYKMFPLMTTLMLYNLPTKQQLAFLGVLFLLGGLKGEPFADDLMDIYDTLLQKLGFTHDSVELELIQTLEKIMPGSSPWIMYGGIDALAFGGTMSTRISMGDNIPLTGAFREGADLGREIIQAFGPAAAANAAFLEEAFMLADFALQQAGFKPQTTTLADIVRKIPQSQLRGIGEAIMMGATGEITDPNGRLTSDEVTVLSMMSRALGFYPLESTRANTAVRLDRMHTGYMRAVRARFILAYANAYRADDETTMDRINQSVQDWNEAAEATGQEDMMIRNFRSAAIRAGRAASQTTIERTSEGAPDYSLIDELATIMNADEESEDN